MRHIRMIAIVAMLAATALAARTKTMNVQVREAQVRQAPGFLSRILVTVPYTEPVTVIEEKGDWMRVQTGSTEGWMHNTALTTKRLKLSGSGPDAQVTVTSDEQALAGKGFNSDVEKQFKERNAKIDFAVVDKMEKLKIPVAEIQAFLKKGEVAPLEGGAK